MSNNELTDRLQRQARYVAKVRAGFVLHIHVPVLQLVETEKSPFGNLPEKRRTLYSLTKDEMEWLKPLLLAQIEFEDVDAGWSHAAPEL